MKQNVSASSYPEIIYPTPYCFLENETKRSHHQADRKQMSLPPILKNQTKHLGFDITEK